MLDNMFTRQSPKMNDTVWKRDMFGDVVRDEENKPVEIQRVMITTCPRGLHVHMMKPKSEGGYARAWEVPNKTARYSLSSIVAYWPNWLVQMTDADMNICGCKTCTETNDLHDALKSKRRKIVNEIEGLLKNMNSSRRKTELEADLAQYKKEIYSADGKSHKHENGMGAADEWGCGERIEVAWDDNTRQFPHYSCILGNCEGATNTE